MKYLVLLFLLARSYASDDVFGDLLGQEYEATAAHIRERRQAQHNEPQIAYRPFSNAPSHLQQIVKSLDARPPLVSIPVKGIPDLGYGKAAHPQQAQVNQYRPQVQFVNGPKQSNLGNVQAGQAQHVPNYATGRVGQAQHVPNYATAGAGHAGPGGRPLPKFIGAGSGDSGQPPVQYSKNVPGNIQGLLNFQHQWAHPQTQHLPRQHRALNHNQQSRLIH